LPAGDRIQTLHGNTEGLKPSDSRTLQALYDRRVPADRVITPELARRLTEISRQLGRQVGLVIDRGGSVTHVLVGEAHRLFIPELGRMRAGASRLRGLRLIHTHLRGEGLSRDDLTDLALLRFDAMVVIQAGQDGLPGAIEMATLRADSDGQPAGGDGGWLIERVPSVHGWETDLRVQLGALEADIGRRDDTRKVSGGEGAILVGVTTGDPADAQASLDELDRLAHTAGLQVLDRVLQVRKAPDGRTVIGKGKLEEVLVRAMQLGADVLIFDNDLAPSQLRNVATTTDLKVIDRTQLILDIFSIRAQSREGKLQIELAQLRYRRPRLAIMPTAMSRLTGGIGGRGPGETKLEINRRRADERETRLERELEKLARDRTTRRAQRQRVGLPQVSIVGYTNAGKSTLLNTMTRSAVDAEDKLFATLDPTSRRMRFPEEREVILTDTVGFIRNLPADLKQAFRSTLEEVNIADLVLHVADASSPELETHLREVELTLADLCPEPKPTLLVLNKIDAVDPALWPELRQRTGALLVSAVEGHGLDALVVELERRLFRAGASARFDAATNEEAWS
jgi:GTPase